LSKLNVQNKKEEEGEKVKNIEGKKNKGTGGSLNLHSGDVFTWEGVCGV